MGKGMKRLLSIHVAALIALAATAPVHATGEKHETRFSDVAPLEPLPKSRSDAAEIAANVPGSAAVLLEALRWRGRTASQIGLPTRLWCADFMNFVLRRRSGAARSS